MGCLWHFLERHLIETTSSRVLLRCLRPGKGNPLITPSSHQRWRLLILTSGVLNKGRLMRDRGLELLLIRVVSTSRLALMILIRWFKISKYFVGRELPMLLLLLIGQLLTHCCIATHWISILIFIMDITETAEYCHHSLLFCKGLRIHKASAADFIATTADT